MKSKSYKFILSKVGVLLLLTSLSMFSCNNKNNIGETEKIVETTVESTVETTAKPTTTQTATTTTTTTGHTVRTFDISKVNKDNNNNTNEDLIDTLTEITDKQLVCNQDNVKIWLMNVQLDTENYNAPCWVINGYIENNTSKKISIDFDYTSVEDNYSLEFSVYEWLNNGQKDLFTAVAYESDKLKNYGIESINSVQGEITICDENFNTLFSTPFNILVNHIGNVFNIETVEADDLINNSNTIYCEEEDCDKEGIYSISLFDKTGYYCKEHYDKYNKMMEEIVDTYSFLKENYLEDYSD